MTIAFLLLLVLTSLSALIIAIGANPVIVGLCAIILILGGVIAYLLGQMAGMWRF